jgi:hypothetical protein
MPSAENRGTIRGGVAEAKALTFPAARGRRSGEPGLSPRSGRGRVRFRRRSHAEIRDGIIKGTGIEWSINVRARVTRAGASLANRRWRHGYRQCGPCTTVPARSASGEPVRPAERATAFRSRIISRPADDEEHRPPTTWDSSSALNWPVTTRALTALMSGSYSGRTRNGLRCEVAGTGPSARQRALRSGSHKTRRRRRQSRANSSLKPNSLLAGKIQATIAV